MKILILTGGRVSESLLSELIERENFDHTIVVDGALTLWDRLFPNRFFDHLVGDFDTVSEDILNKYLGRKELSVHRFNPVKDYTDTDIALKLAVKLFSELDEEKAEQKGENELFLMGATGTRLDHTLANLQLLEQLRGRHITGRIIDAHNQICLLEGEICLERSRLFGDFISLIPVTENLKDVTMEGFKYPLKNSDVHMGESLCVSNEMTGEHAFIRIGKGRAYLIQSRD